GFRRPPRLLVSRRLRVPFSCGLWRPTVVIPAALCAGPAPRQLRWVFAHELTHLARRDAWSCLLFGLGQALFFYLPWLWWLRRQVRLCQEYVADAVAVGPAGPRPAGVAADYAQFLLNLIHAPAVPVAATGVLGSYSDLFRRVTMLLESPTRVERRCPRRWSWAAAGGLLALAVLLSGIGPGAAPAEEAPAAVKQANKAANLRPVPVARADDRDPARKEEPKKEPAKNRGRDV